MCTKHACLTSLILVLALVACAQAGIEGHWSFDEGSGSTAADSSGNNHHATLKGGVSWAGEGSPVNGDALSFDGYSDGANHTTDPGNIDWVSVDPFDVVGPGIALAAWIRPDGFDIGDARIVTKQKTWSSIDIWWMLSTYTDGTALRMRLKTDDGGADDGTTTMWSGTGYLEAGVWSHAAATYDGSKMRLYHNGVEVMSTNKAGTIRTDPTAAVAIGNSPLGDPGGLRATFHGLIDEVLVCDRAISQAQVQDLVSGILPDWRKASDPSPADGALYADTWASLTWLPGDTAASHDVYVGDNFADVNDGTGDTFRGNQDTEMLIVGFFGYPYPDGLAPGTTYYWRIDEVEADGITKHKGNVWSFTIPPREAYNPDPPDGAEFVGQDVTLSWASGLNAKVHYVYFGDNSDDVNNATVGVPTVVTSYTPGTLELEKTYYWRVDESDGVTTFEGDVWSFTTLPVIAIADPRLKGWWKLDEGYGPIAVDWSGHDNHGSVTGTALSWMPDDGMIGGALSFNGTASDTDYVEVSTADVSLAAGTVAMWAKLRANPQAPATRYFFGHTTIPAYSDRIQLYMNNSDTILDLGLGDSHDRHTDIMSLTTETWYHVALTWDGGRYVVYVNGEEKANGSYTGLDALNPAANIGNDGNPGERTEAFNGLLDNVRIYDYALPQAEILNSMRGDPLLAWNPSPDNSSTVDVDRAKQPLTWSPGDNAAQHDVYFGTDRTAVEDANASDTTGIYRGRQSPASYTPSEGVEWGGGPYYWRIDEFNTDGTISTGGLWSFAVADYLIVDDFESYNDIPEGEPGSNRIYLAWIDGFNNPTVNGAYVGYVDPPLMERGNVHGGSQSLPYSYDNNFKSSQATRALTSLRDWTQEGVTKLSLWFYGDPANAPERMNVALNGTAPVYHDDPSAATIGAWTEWIIDLSRFGVPLTNVTSITIGFGVPGSTAAGGTGDMLFDDIRLIR
jgi:hypothetical protein